MLGAWNYQSAICRDRVSSGATGPVDACGAFAVDKCGQSSGSGLPDVSEQMINSFTRPRPQALFPTDRLLVGVEDYLREEVADLAATTFRIFSLQILLGAKRTFAARRNCQIGLCLTDNAGEDIHLAVYTGWTATFPPSEAAPCAFAARAIAPLSLKRIGLGLCKDNLSARPLRKAIAHMTTAAARRRNTWTIHQRPPTNADRDTNYCGRPLERGTSENVER
jgi:hypothetical protein